MKKPEKLTLATRNSHKVQEIKEILSSLPLLTEPAPENLPEIIEDGATFLENAKKKAIEISQMIPGLIMSDDSGLEVDCLDGKPGVYSARFAGHNSTDAENINKLLYLMENVKWEERTSKFICVIALAQEGTVIQTFEGTCKGYILSEPRGTSGFGYDPVFYYPPYKQSFGEISASRKNLVSHRNAALILLEQFLSSFLS